jgi:CTP synthase
VKDTPPPVISLLEEQEGVEDMGGTMRLGAYPCAVVPGTIAARAYGRESVSERHRHRFEYNNAYRDRMVDAGLVISGTSPDESLVEVVELADHPFFLACQYHPEFQSRPIEAHPFFRDFVAAARGREKGRATAARRRTEEVAE